MKGALNGVLEIIIPDCPRERIAQLLMIENEENQL